MLINDTNAALRAAREDVAEKEAGSNPPPGPTPSQERFLGVAARLHRSGEPVNAARMASEAGVPLGYARDMVGTLRANGLWPYAAPPIVSATSAANGDGNGNGNGNRKPAPAAAARPRGKASSRPDPVAGPEPEIIVNSDSKADGELLVIQRCLTQLHRLSTPDAVRRVLVYLADRLDEQEVS